ncbi:MAG: hypothetical protein HC886_01740 [Leptolyngbyaceae cyanobacterium SM1_1_3]|nr:hypothetical protein [Leptolyngbyaceae cyanobacterium SM1_1_3]
MATAAMAAMAAMAAAGDADGLLRPALKPAKNLCRCPRRTARTWRSGGSATAGCDCRDRRWQVRQCSGTLGQPDYSCRTREFVCRDGESGRTGQDGREGRDGALGQLVLINQLEPLLADQPQQTKSLAELTEPTTLTKNLWRTQTGARSLLAPGSNVADTYQEYAGRVEGRFVLDWSAARSLSDLATVEVMLQLQDNGQVQPNFSEALWVIGASSHTDDLTTYGVTDAMRASEATQLALGSVSGRSNQFQVAVLDLGGQTDQLSTQFHLTYSTAAADRGDGPRTRYISRYEDFVPADLVTRSQNRFVLNLGRLPISGNHLRSGTSAKFELKAVRTFGPYQAEQILEWQGRL